VSAVAVREALGDMVLLSEVLAGAAPDQQPVPGFEARLCGGFVDGSDSEGLHTVTVVLERTAVVEVAPGDRRLARHDALLVDANSIRWQEAALGHSFVHRLRGSRVARDSIRAASDRRALRSQSSTGERRRRGSPQDVIAPAPAAAAAFVEAATPPPDVPRTEEREAQASEAAPEPRRCQRCEAELPAHNRRGLCVPCQRTCPTCQGPKSIPAPQCRRCGQRAEAQPAPDPRASVELALQELPVRVQELLDQVVTLTRYARWLEEELERYRAAELEMARIGRHAVLAGRSQ
jgi:hypothetical protein